MKIKGVEKELFVENETAKCLCDSCVYSCTDIDDMPCLECSKADRPIHYEKSKIKIVPVAGYFGDSKLEKVIKEMAGMFGKESTTKFILNWIDSILDS